MALGGCRERGAEPLLPSLPFPARLLPARGPGTLSGVPGAGLGAQPGPTSSQPTPVGSSGARPASQVWPLARGRESAPLPAWMQPLLLEREGQLCQGGQSFPGWMAAPAPLLGASFPSQGVPRSFFLLVSGIPGLFSAEQVGCRSSRAHVPRASTAQPAPHPPPAPRAHLLPSPCSLSRIKAASPPCIANIIQL